MPLKPGYQPKIYYSQTEPNGGFEGPRDNSFKSDDPRSWTAREWHKYFQGLDSKSDGFKARENFKVFANR
jgi:hypothetical protein